MIKGGFLLCPECNKKIQPIADGDVIISTVFCKHCKTYHEVVIAKGKLLKMERSVTR